MYILLSFIQSELLEKNNDLAKHGIFQKWYTQLDFDERYHVGHTLEGMVLSCSFGFQNCENR